MSVTEADVMLLMGEQVTLGPTQTAEYSAAIERQHAYEAEQRAEFGRPGHDLPLAAVPWVTAASLGSLASVTVGGGRPSIPGIGGPGGGSQTRLPQLDPQVNFPPRGFGGEPLPLPRPPPPPPEMQLPVPYEGPVNPGVWAIPGIGAILGGIIGAMWEGWPNALDPERGPYDTRTPRDVPNQIDSRQSGPDLGDLRAGPTDMQGPPSPPGVGDNPPYPSFPDFGGGPSQDPLPGDIGLGPVPDYGPPQGARQPAPAPAPRTLPPWVWPVVGTIGAWGLSRAGRRSSQTLPASPLIDFSGMPGTTLTVINEPLLSSGVLAGAGPMTMTSTGGAFDTVDDHCNCAQKRPGKKRKCLARAQLSWRSGPKKGKPAGSRCIRFAT